MCSLGDKIQGSESICQTALPHLLLSDAHSTSVGYSFPTAVANLCVTRDIFAGKYFSCNYIELTKQCFFCSFCSAGYVCQKATKNCALLTKEILNFFLRLCVYNCRSLTRPV